MKRVTHKVPPKPPAILLWLDGIESQARELQEKWAVGDPGRPYEENYDWKAHDILLGARLVLESIKEVRERIGDTTAADSAARAAAAMSVLCDRMFYVVDVQQEPMIRRGLQMSAGAKRSRDNPYRRLIRRTRDGLKMDGVEPRPAQVWGGLKSHDHEGIIESIDDQARTLKFKDRKNPLSYHNFCRRLRDLPPIPEPLSHDG